MTKIIVLLPSGERSERNYLEYLHRCVANDHRDERLRQCIAKVARTEWEEARLRIRLEQGCT